MVLCAADFDGPEPIVSLSFFRLNQLGCRKRRVTYEKILWSGDLRERVAEFELFTMTMTSTCLQRLRAEIPVAGPSPVGPHVFGSSP